MTFATVAAIDITCYSTVLASYAMLQSSMTEQIFKRFHDGCTGDAIVLLRLARFRSRQSVGRLQQRRPKRDRYRPERWAIAATALMEAEDEDA